MTTVLRLITIKKKKSDFSTLTADCAILEKTKTSRVSLSPHWRRPLHVSVFTLRTDISGILLCGEELYKSCCYVYRGSDIKRRSATAPDKLTTCQSHHKGTDWQMYKKRVRWPNARCLNTRHALLKTSTVVQGLLLIV